MCLKVRYKTQCTHKLWPGQCLIKIHVDRIPNDWINNLDTLQNLIEKLQFMTLFKWERNLWTLCFPSYLKLYSEQLNIHISAVPTCNTTELVKTIYIRRSWVWSVALSIFLLMKCIYFTSLHSSTCLSNAIHWKKYKKKIK